MVRWMEPQVLGNVDTGLGDAGWDGSFVKNCFAWNMQRRESQANHGQDGQDCAVTAGVTLRVQKERPTVATGWIAVVVFTLEGSYG